MRRRARQKSAVRIRHHRLAGRHRPELGSLGVDFHTAENELEQQTIGMYLAVSRGADSVLCSASDTLTIHYTSGLTAELRPEDRELVRAKLEEALDTGWPGYVTTALADTKPAA